MRHTCTGPTPFEDDHQLTDGEEFCDVCREIERLEREVIRLTSQRNEWKSLAKMAIQLNNREVTRKKIEESLAKIPSEEE